MFDTYDVSIWAKLNFHNVIFQSSQFHSLNLLLPTRKKTNTYDFVMHFSWNNIIFPLYFHTYVSEIWDNTMHLLLYLFLNMVVGLQKW